MPDVGHGANQGNRLHNDPVQGAKDVGDQAKRQYSDGDYKIFRHEVLKELEKPKSS